MGGVHMAQENKVYKQYHVDFSSKWISTSAFFAGLSFFILVAKYFGIENIKQVGFGEICFSMALPLLVLTVFGVLLRGFQFRVTPLYGILAALYCVLMIIRTFSYAGAGSTVLGLVWYLLTGALTVVTTFGFFPGKVYMMLSYVIPVIYRICFVDIDTYFRTRDWLGFLPEAAALSGLLAFSLFALCLKIPQKK